MLAGLGWAGSVIGGVYTTRSVVCFKDTLAGSHNRGGGLELVVWTGTMGCGLPEGCSGMYNCLSEICM